MGGPNARGAVICRLAPLYSDCQKRGGLPIPVIPIGIGELFDSVRQ